MKTGSGRLKLYRAISVAMLAFSAYLYFLAASKRVETGDTWRVEDILAIAIFLLAVGLMIFSTYRLKRDHDDKS